LHPAIKKKKKVVKYNFFKRRVKQYCHSPSSRIKSISITNIKIYKKILEVGYHKITSQVQNIQ